MYSRSGKTISERQCRFSDELVPGHTMFKEYTRHGCRLECRLKEAAEVGLMQCGVYLH